MVIALHISKNLYSKEALLKTIYNFKDVYNIMVESNEDNYILSIDSKCFDKNTFLKFLNEQELRESLNLQFGKLRETIYKKAFSHVE